MAIFPPITEEAMRGLSRWARVAFAAKCGRRVQPLLRRYWKSPNQDVLQAFDNAIALAEQSAAQGAATAGLDEVVRKAALYAPAMAGMPAFRPYGSPARSVPRSDIVCHAVASSALAAASAAQEAGDANDAGSTEAVLDAYEWAAQAAAAIGAYQIDTVLRNDFSFLKSAAERSGYTDATPIPPDSFAWEKELATYKRSLPNLLKDEGKFVAIKGDQVIGTWNTLEDAMQAGYDQFGLNAVLVKRIGELVD